MTEPLPPDDLPLEALLHLRKATGILSAAACSNPSLHPQANRLVEEVLELANKFQARITLAGLKGDPK